VKDEDIEMYVGDPKLSQFFEEVIANLGGDKEKIKSSLKLYHFRYGRDI
jgi:hypothetical protein